MRRVLSVALALTCVTAFASADIVLGNGAVKTEKREVRSFKSISVSGSGVLKVHRGGQRIEITSDSNVLPYITTEVIGDSLKIGFKPFTSLLRTTKLQFDVTLPELDALRLSGSGNAFVDSFSGDRFSGDVSGSGAIKAELDYSSIDLSCSGSGGFDADVKARKLMLRSSGSCEIYLNGSAGSADVDISGSARVGARNLQANDARVTISGSGGVELRAQKSLDCRLSGAGRVSYWGSPSVSQKVSGSGSISKAGD